MLLFCARCAVWWDTTSSQLKAAYDQSRRRCPKCFNALEEKPIVKPTHQPRTELRPGVAAEWE